MKTRDLEKLADLLVPRILAGLKLTPAAAPVADLNETVDVEQLQVMLRCDSRSATYRAAKKIGIRPYTRGKYRRKDVVERIARSSFHANKEAA